MHERMRHWGLWGVCLGLLIVCAATVGYAQDEAPTGAAAAEEEKFYFNVEDGDIHDIVRQISKATGRVFILDDRLLGHKLNIFSERPLTKEEVHQIFISALYVAGLTIVEGSGGMYKVVSLQEAKSNPIPFHDDSTPDSDLLMTRVVALHHVSAIGVMNNIRGLMSVYGDITVNPHTNSLLIVDTATQINRLLKIITQLDPAPPQIVVESFPVAGESAKSVQELFISLMKQDGQKGEPWASEVTAVLINEHSNELVVQATERTMPHVRQIVLSLLGARLLYVPLWKGLALILLGAGILGVFIVGIFSFIGSGLRVMGWVFVIVGVVGGIIWGVYYLDDVKSGYQQTTETTDFQNPIPTAPFQIWAQDRN